MLHDPQGFEDAEAHDFRLFQGQSEEPDEERDEEHSTGDASDIPPALTAEEWSDARTYNAFQRRRYAQFLQEIEREPAAIAVINDRLHNEDPRKLTREHVELLRAAAQIIERQMPPIPIVGEYTQGAFDRLGREAEMYSQLLELADVLESYLAPQEAVPLPAGASDEPGRESSAASRLES